MLVPVAFEGRVGAYDKVDLDDPADHASARGSPAGSRSHRTAIRVDDANDDPRGMTIPGTDDVDESMLVVPMLHDDALVGVVTLSKLGLRQFDEDDLRLLSILGRPGRDGVRGASHVAETRRLAAELRQLLDMSSALSRSLDPVDGRRPDGRAPRPGRRRRPGADQRLGPGRRTGCGRWAATRPSSARRSTTTYPLDGFPLTLRVLEERGIRSWTSRTPTADAAEVAFLRERRDTRPA